MSNISRTKLSSKLYKELLSHNVSELTSICKTDKEAIISHLSDLMQSKISLRKRLVFSEQRELEKFKTTLFSSPFLPENAFVLDIDKLISANEVESNTLKFNWINKISSANLFNVSIDKKLCDKNKPHDKYKDVFTLLSKLGKQVDLNSLSNMLFSSSLSEKDRNFLNDLGVDQGRLPLTIWDMAGISVFIGFYPIISVSSKNAINNSILENFLQGYETQIDEVGFIEFSTSLFDDISSGFISPFSVLNLNFSKFNPYSEVIDLRICASLKSDGKHQISMLDILQDEANSKEYLSEELKDKVNEFKKGFLDFVEQEKGAEYNFTIPKGLGDKCFSCLANGLMSYIEETSHPDDIYLYLLKNAFSPELINLDSQFANNFKEIMKTVHNDDESDFDIFSDSDTETDDIDDYSELCLEDDLFDDNSPFDEEDYTLDEFTLDESSKKIEIESRTYSADKKTTKSDMSIDSILIFSSFIFAIFVIASNLL